MSPVAGRWWQATSLLPIGSSFERGLASLLTHLANVQEARLRLISILTMQSKS
jgi:hypothetical protein